MFLGSNDLVDIVEDETTVLPKTLSNVIANPEYSVVQTRQMYSKLVTSLND